MADRLLTAREAAERLGVEKITIVRWLRSGRLPGIKIGTRGDWRIRASELDAYIEDSEGKRAA